MKRATVVSALLIAVACLFSSSTAQASCQNICVRALKNCLDSGWPADDCYAEHADCLTACGGGGSISGKLALKDEGREHGRRQAQSCVTERGERTARRAPLARVTEPKDRGRTQRASQSR